ncbi:cell division protein FtsQ/DivIB [Actinokineospora cianjurensis]|uniref:Cell division protein FtsQ n=1 Tax=Actinokineospora cianjurensis TaxID=585224 RepID=A0A421BCT3_9PSEU|nr:FtsQ-type POTRA domain-containing protein [Actinokineospora cianjurensis]RLK62195.1 cell division protein FtsQ [Actinokineospora cianjurensis]
MTSTVPGRRTRRRPRGAQRPARRRTARRYLVRRWTVLGSLLAVTGLVVLVFFTPVLGANTVEVTGIKDLTADEVRAAAAIEPGTPLATLDTDEIAARIRQLPRVGSVDVSRSFPATVELAITERTPVAVAVRDDGAHLLDAAGVDYGTIKAPPPGLPVLDASGDNATRAATAVLAGVPPQLAKVVVSVTARTPTDIRLTLADRRVVKWGDAKNVTRKAAVLGALLTQEGKTFDVAAPDFPTIS